MWHYSTLGNTEQFFWWKLMLRNHLLILPSSWNNSINVPDKMCYRETTFFRFVSCIADSLSLQKSQLLCWLLWITPPQDVCFPPCFLHVGQGKRCDWLWFVLFSYWWGITGCSFTQIPYLPLEILNYSYLFLSVRTSFVFFNFLVSYFLASWRNITWLSLRQIWL